MKIISWNVNGINSCINKGLIDFVMDQDADIYCFQEIKCSSQTFVNPLFITAKYNSFPFFSAKNGYSGLLIYSKIKPISVIRGINNQEVDKEARILTLEYDKFYLINVYFPHSNRGLTRLQFKLKFNQLFSDFCQKLKQKKPLIITGDFNVVHKEIDIKNYKANEGGAGVTIEERKWFDEFLESGYTDTFREFIQEEGHYTWWSYLNDCRQRDIGWRIDYSLISHELKDSLKDSTILKEIIGSDHCPICLEVEL